MSYVDRVRTAEQEALLVSMGKRSQALIGQLNANKADIDAGLSVIQADGLVDPSDIGLFCDEQVAIIDSAIATLQQMRQDRLDLKATLGL